MDIGKFKQILLQVFLLPVVALLLMAFALYSDMRSGANTVNQIVQYDARIAQATLVYKLVIDEESGLRGYQTTSDARFLEPFTKAQAVLDQRLSELEEGSDSQAQLDHVKHLRESHQTWIDAFAKPVMATMRAGGNADDVDLNLQGKTLMDGIRTDLNAILAEAQSRRASLIAIRQENRYHLQILMFVLAIVMGLAIGIFARNRLHAVADAYRDSLDTIKRRADELFESEQELRTTLTSIGDGVITCDAKGCIQMMNPVAEELTGWGFEEAKGHPLEEISESSTRPPAR